MKNMKTVFIALCLTLATLFSFTAAAIPPFLPYDVYLCGIIDPDGADRTGWQTLAGSWLSCIDNSAIYKKTAFSATNLAAYIKASEMFVIHTHSAYNASALKSIDSNGVASYLYRSDVMSWSSGALNSLDLAFIGACSSGKDGANGTNFVTAFRSKGADCVIGYLTNVVTQCNYTMLESFCSAIGAGYSVSEALVYADSTVLSTYATQGNTQLRLVLGTTSLRLASNLTPLSSVQPTEPEIEGYEQICITFDEITETTTTIYGKYVNGVLTEDIAYTITDRDGRLLYADQNKKGVLDGFSPTQSFFSDCYEKLAVELKNCSEKYEIVDKVIVGTKDYPGIRYEVLFSGGEYEHCEFIYIY